MKNILFSELLFQSNFNDDDFKKKIISILEYRQNTDVNYIRSNVGGYHTKHLKDADILKTLANWTKETLQPHLKKNCRIVIPYYWINENKKNSYNMTHIHGGFNMAAVYYLHVPEDSGRIYFQDSTKDMTFLENYFGEDCISQVEIKNHSNQLLIFPAHLTHGVTINKSDFTRITVAFNIILDDSIKETDLKKS